MKRLVSAEALKLRTTRTFPMITLGALALIAIATAAASGLGDFHANDHPGRDMLGLGALAHTFALLLGVLAVTAELRFGTITPSLLVTPKRVPLLIAKVLNVLRFGLTYGLVAFVSAAAVALPILHSRGVATRLDGSHLAAIVAGGTVATALFAAIGVGIGAVVRNQAGAIVASLGLLYAVEPLLTFIPHLGDAVQRFGLGGLSSGATGTAGFQSDIEVLAQVPASLVLAGYALGLLLLGASLLKRRDVTG